VIVAVALLEVGVVLTVKVAVLAPAATVTVAGTVAAELEDVRLITWPPVGAAVFSVTVPVELVPPITDAGLRVTELVDGGSIVMLAPALLPPPLAVIVATVAVETAVVVIEN